MRETGSKITTWASVFALCCFAVAAVLLIYARPFKLKHEIDPMVLMQVGAIIGVGALLQQYVSRKSSDARGEKEIIAGQIRSSLTVLDSLHASFELISEQGDAKLGPSIISNCKILGMRLQALQDLARHCGLPQSADRTEAIMAIFVRYRYAVTERPGMPTDADRVAAKTGYQKLTIEALLMT